MSRGRGISVVNDIGSVSYSERVVCQRYLTNPLLLSGYKFDLRIYVLVTSFSPLEAFVFREGFARMSSQKFSLEKGSIANKWVHLTNSSIQKNAKDTMPADNPCKTSGENGGSKISLTHLWKALEKEGVDTKNMWKKVCDLCLKTLMVSEDSIPSQPNAFEVFGFDVIFDENLNAWLIEVNASPAMARETRLDEKIKEAMIHDTIKIVDPPQFDRKELVSVCERRMKAIQKKSSHKTGGKGCFKTEKDQLEDDLVRILRGVHPRRYGEIPKEMGSYQRLAPGERTYEALKKARSRMFFKSV
jgi:tubulin polyglutamylase TTLL5